MIDTDFWVPAEKLNRLATLYGPGLLPVEESQASNLAQPPRLIAGGNGLVSTGPDYLRFCQMLLNGGQLDGVRILGRKTVAFMTINHLPTELMPIQFPVIFLRGYGWELGWSILTDVKASEAIGSMGEYGWVGSYRTYFWVDPTEEIIGIVMSQLEGELPEIRHNYYHYLRAIKPLYIRP